ncbi:MAG TPA: 50S ribosomal protein L29 [Rickettsiales bacterium]|nr:50S ribosomal protein L29 [Rickettsiales bacterium]
MSTKKEENKSVLADISNLKKELMMMRIKSSSGDSIVVKDYRNKKKEVARLFTKINDKKTKKA